MFPIHQLAVNTTARESVFGTELVAFIARLVTEHGIVQRCTLTGQLLYIEWRLTENESLSSRVLPCKKSREGERECGDCGECCSDCWHCVLVLLGLMKRSSMCTLHSESPTFPSIYVSKQLLRSCVGVAFMVGMLARKWHLKRTAVTLCSTPEHVSGKPIPVLLFLVCSWRNSYWSESLTSTQI